MANASCQATSSGRLFDAERSFLTAASAVLSFTSWPSLRTIASCEALEQSRMNSAMRSSETSPVGMP
jgi:hypothetical protein